MKKITAVISVLLALALLFCACGKTEPVTPADTTAPAVPTEPADPAEKAEVNLGLLKGPTGMGAALLLDENEKGKARNSYNVTLAGAPDALQAAMISGELDIAALPTNVASVLYAKTEGKVQILAVNTLGVLYIMSKDANIKSFADLAGKTVLSAGQGTTAEYVLNYLLQKNGVTDVNVEFAAEHAEVLTKAAAGGYDTVLLPEPFVTQMKNTDASFETVLDLTAEWKALGGGALTMGCIAVRKAFADENPGAVEDFLSDYEESIGYVNASPAEAAQLIETYEIAKAAIAESALPRCNITFMSGETMKENVSAYLGVLAEANPQSVGGKLPDDGFYYIALSLADAK